MAGRKGSKIVSVIWEDASSQTSDWISAKDVGALVKKTICHSAGILVERTDKHIVLALNANHDGSAVADFMRIPAGMVRKVKVWGWVK